MSIAKRRAPYAPATDLAGARINLSHFVQEQAAMAAEEFGFGWVGTWQAPSTYPQLRGAFQHSRATGEPLPVSDLFCEDTIFIEVIDNIAFRFWHDVSHCRLGFSFAMPDEWELSLWHLEQLEHAGLGPETREYQLLRADLLGQVILLAVAGRFPFNQGEFTRRCGEAGLDAGVLIELRRLA